MTFATTRENSDLCNSILPTPTTLADYSKDSTICFSIFCTRFVLYIIEQLLLLIPSVAHLCIQLIHQIVKFRNYW